jgi:hypothetical protein
MVLRWSRKTGYTDDYEAFVICTHERNTNLCEKYATSSRPQRITSLTSTYQFGDCRTKEACIHGLLSGQAQRRVKA